MSASSRSYGAFTGVFIPTFLSVIGVILFLRLGFVVGAAGILGSALIILLAVSITISTGLSLSSITTNIRIGSGGAYSIITKTLGLEVGGSVGIPLYFAQIFSVALYLFGFQEAWGFIFPDHHPLLVVAFAFLALILLIGVSTDFAIRAQLVVFFFVLAALVAVFLGADFSAGLNVPLATSFTDFSFWQIFALFFPATTGLMAGIGLSGRLSDPKRQIPYGVMSAIGITTVIYLAVSLWFANVSQASTLMESSQIIVVESAFPTLVLIGILAATFSSALTTMIAAPYLLASMGRNGVVPLSKTVASAEGADPTRAIWVSLFFVAILLATGSLNAIAPVLTMFFLITYAMINLVVFLEKRLGSVSFRPTLSVPSSISAYGAVMSGATMFLINPYAGLGAIILLFVTYTLLTRRKLKPNEGDVRSGLFTSIAIWAAQMVGKFPESSKHNWKPSILLPVVTTRTLLGNFPVVRNIAYPNGTMTVLGLRLTGRSSTPESGDVSKAQRERELKQLPALVQKFSQEHLFINNSIVEVRNYTNGICVSLESIESQVLHPNLLFLSFPPSDLPKYDLKRIFETARRSNVGVILLDRDKEVGLGSEQDIHVWISDDVLKKDFYDDRDFDLAMILAYRMFTNWKGRLTVWMTTSKRKHKEAEKYAKKLLYEARFPTRTQVNVVIGDLQSSLKDAPSGDLHIVPVLAKDVESLSRFAVHKDKSFMFVSDGTKEDILA